MDGNTRTVGVVGVTEYEGVPVIWGSESQPVTGERFFIDGLV